MEQKQLPQITSIKDISDEMARNYAENLSKKSYVKGILLWGSRATRFGAKTTDWDALVYVTDEYFQTLSPMDIGVYLYDETVEPKRLVIDYTYFSDIIFKNQLHSPMDIDHSAYAEAITIFDPSGKLEEWRAKLAEFPDSQYETRAKIKWIDIAITLGAAKLDHKRELYLNRNINLYRTLVGTIHFWFTLQKQWTPPLKWWSQHVEQLDIPENTYTLFSSALKDPTLEHVDALVKHLRKLGENEYGLDFSTLHADYMETIMPQGRQKLLRHGYL